MSSNKTLIRPFLILTLLDVIILALFIIWINATPDVSIIVIVIIPGLVIANIIVAILIYLFKRNNFYGGLFLANAIIAPLIFHWLFKIWFIYWDKINFDHYNFQIDNKRHELLLDKRDTSFIFLEKYDMGLSVEYKRGKYEILKSEIILLDSGNRMKLVNDKLIGYPKINYTITLKK